MVSLLVALDVEERVSVPELGLPRPAERDGGGLAVPDQHLASGELHVSRARPSVQSGLAGGTSRSLELTLMSLITMADVW